jgi:hypothetical protein
MPAPAQRIPKDRLPEIGRVVDSLVPRDLSNALDLPVEEERPCTLRRILCDLIREEGIVLDEQEDALVEASMR